MEQKGLRVQELRCLEETAKRIGFSERLLVENATANLCRIITDLNLGDNVIIVAGKGNNGADVLSCARKLHNQGCSVKVELLQYDLYSPELLWQESILRAEGVPLWVIGQDGLEDIRFFFKQADYILDGIFGIGIKNRVEGFEKKIIEEINASGKKIVSCDIPSGLSPDEGVVLGEAVKADYTITFIDKKQGFYANQGPDFCGKIIVTDIGLTKEALERIS